MKKVMSIIAVALFAVATVACGPSAEEKAKMEERAKQVTDSIANAISESMAAPTEEAAPATDSAAASTEAAPAAEAGH
ncbi:MAG: hypothetical protein IPM51_14250 [Sphingobacteriaceae bacterium]|nr:hypothetical protein [Sphingobacteriaceae bacterium]